MLCLHYGWKGQTYQCNMPRTQISVGQEARRLAKETESPWKDSRRRNGSGPPRLGQQSPATSGARQLQHLPSSTSSDSRGSGSHRDLAPSTQGRSQPLASHDLASLGFVLGDFIFCLHQGKSFEQSMNFENYWHWNARLEWLQKVWLSEYDEFLLHTGIY